ncbi:MAG: DUF4278 domain-containing protein [Symploca sp. SIO2B6]|nr:DUF4278 domain-containing protein [Symploca sp. SIO2B6]
MALTYRGCKVQSNTVTVNTIESATQGKYRGASVGFRQVNQPIHKVTTTKQYRGATY